MKNLMTAFALFLSTSTFAVQPPFCDDVQQTYENKYQELVRIKEIHLSHCEKLVENASFRCIQKTLNNYDRDLKNLDKQTSHSFNFCI